MTLQDFRTAIEQAVPLWAWLAMAVIGLVILAVVVFAWRGPRSRAKHRRVKGKVVSAPGDIAEGTQIGGSYYPPDAKPIESQSAFPDEDERKKREIRAYLADSAKPRPRIDRIRPGG